MRKSESHEENSSAPRSPENALSDGVLRDIFHSRISEGDSEDLIATAEANLRFLQSNCSGLAFDDIIDILNGGTGSIGGLWHEDDVLREGKIDLEALQLLFGAMKYAGESDEDAAKLSYIIYYHYCEEDEESRKFTNWPEQYRQNQLREAIKGFDLGEWHRWRRRENADGFDEEDYRNWTDDYSDITYDILVALVKIGCEGVTPEDATRLYEIDLPESSEEIENLHNGIYTETSSFTKIGGVSDSPSSRGLQGHRYVPMKVVVETAKKVDGRSEKTYKNAIRRLRKRGVLKWAEITPGQDYRIYPSMLPDPEEAERIKFEGEEYTPESASPTVEPEIMTDGGVSMAPEAKQDLERIRKAREGSDETTESPETFTCPIEGCSRTVIGSPDALRSHVRQSGEGSHRHRTLDADLEIEFDEEAYHATWGPGLREGSEEPDSIYAGYEGEWGPGAPTVES